MTDRFAGFMVVLDKDIREDDAQQVISAIQMIKGVMSVQPVKADVNTELAVERVRRELGQKILKVIYPEAK